MPTPDPLPPAVIFSESYSKSTCSNSRGMALAAQGNCDQLICGLHASCAETLSGAPPGLSHSDSRFFCLLFFIRRQLCV